MIPQAQRRIGQPTAADPNRLVDLGAPIGLREPIILCQSTDPYPAQEQTYRIYYDLDETDVARPPGTHTSYDTAIMDGIVMLRLPLTRLAAGTTDVAGVNLSGGHEELEWGLRIGLELRSEAGGPLSGAAGALKGAPPAAWRRRGERPRLTANAALSRR